MAHQKFALALAAMLSLQVGGSALAASSCDRQCLEGFVDRYLDAVIAQWSFTATPTMQVWLQDG